MKVKVPNTIKLLTHEYEVKFGTKRVVSAGTCGLTRHLYQDITIDNVTLPPSEIDQVFLHELIHAIERHFCITIEEADVERLAEGLAVILFDNLGIEFDWSEINDHCVKEEE